MYKRTASQNVKPGREREGGDGLKNVFRVLCGACLSLRSTTSMQNAEPSREKFDVKSGKQAFKGNLFRLIHSFLICESVPSQMSSSNAPPTKGQR
jgi:hypothetical protein